MEIVDLRVAIQRPGIQGRNRADIRATHPGGADRGRSLFLGEEKGPMKQKKGGGGGGGGGGGAPPPGAWRRGYTNPTAGRWAWAKPLIFFRWPST